MDPLVTLTGVVKDYQSLRPLRIRKLDIMPGQSVALMGLDEGMAAALVNLLLAGSLPDEGDVVAFGASTRTVRDPERWMEIIDNYGLVSQRSVLLPQLTAAQNLAIPLTLDVGRLSDEMRTAVEELADEIGLSEGDRVLPLSDLSAASVLRIRLGRALALRPRVLIAEHPNATLDASESMTFASRIRAIQRERQLATLTITAERRFAEAIADTVLVLQPATGELKPAARGLLRWFQ